MSALNIGAQGMRLAANALSQGDLRALREASGALLTEGAGQRVFGDERVRRLCAPDGAIGGLVASDLPGARPVRAVLFDKTPARNWAVAWHQDRTIVVKRRIEAEGFGPWSLKGGLIHVEPPFDILQAMLTIRVHLDDCGPDNAPLRVALGSHRIGKVPEGDAAERAQALETYSCLAMAGDAWVYATPILHASAPSAAPDRRRVLQVDFAAGELPQASNGPVSEPGRVERGDLAAPPVSRHTANSP